MNAPDISARVEREAAAVLFLRDQLAALGQTEPEYLDISIESETGFREMIEELLEQEADADADIAKIKARKDVLTERQERFAKRKETFRSLIASALEAADLAKQETAFGTVSLTKVAPKPIITDEAEIPARFWKPAEPTLDMKALADALKQDEQVPGACLSNGGQTITIRRR